MSRVFKNLTKEEKTGGIYNERYAKEIQQICLKYCEVPGVQNYLFYSDDENYRKVYRKLEVRNLLIDRLDAMKKEIGQSKKDEIESIELDIDSKDAKKIENKKIVDTYVKIATLEINKLKNKIQQDINEYNIELENIRQKLKIDHFRAFDDNEEKIENENAKRIYEKAITEFKIFFEDIAKRIIKSSSNVKKRLTKKEKNLVMGQTVMEFLDNFQEQEDNIDYTRIGQKFMELFAEKEQEFKLKD